MDGQRLVAIEEVRKTGRRLRRPSHTFQLRQRPWQIQPFFIAPVWPGETMKNALLQVRAVSDPIKNPLIGWWLEHYVFYVKLRDLADRDALTAMIVTNASTSGLNDAANLKTFHAGGAPDFTYMCLERVIEEWFRDEDEAVTVATLDAVPLAHVGNQSWLDSAKDATLAGESQHEFPGENPALPANMSAFTDHYAQWEAMRSMQLTAATFEDWLETFGVKVPRKELEELHRPELVRYSKSWTYPSNTIDATTGTPSSAVSWSVAERADKDRLFKEPGFLFGVQIARPKIYMSKQKGSLSSFLNDAYSWLPAVLQSEPYTSLKKFIGGASGVGPLGTNTTNDYWVDLRDLAMYGDQFINFALTETDAGLVALPTVGMQKRYAASADADALFSAASPKNQIRSDGVINLSILSRLEDTTL